MAAPKITADHIRFDIHDAHGTVAGARLHQEIARPRNAPEFVRLANGRRWQALFPRPDADRMEYQFEVFYEDGGSELIRDAGNPLTASNPFGARSVLEFPGYSSPKWLDLQAPHGVTTRHEVKSRVLRARIRVDIWEPPDTDPEERLPILIAHDGPEYAEHSALTRLIEAMLAENRLPPMRVALLQPIDRDETYSASATFARALVHEVIPAVDAIAPTSHVRSMRAGMGASLGGLAMLHAHRRSPASFGALFLQSSSFFRQRYDKHESGFPRFRRISRFVGSVLSVEEWAHPIPITMTCGTVEENLANNRAIKDALTKQGYPVTFVENRDAHNWVAWRDCFDPYLVDLLAEVWG